MLWIPVGAKELQVFLMACAYMNEAGHRGAVTILQRLSEYCFLFHMEEYGTAFVKPCLQCMDSKAGEKMCRPLYCRRPCMAPGRAKSSILTTSTLEQAGRWLMTA